MFLKNKCSICDELKTERNYKVICPKKQGCFCINCTSRYIKYYVESGNTTGIVKCPCGCESPINKDIINFRSTRMNRYFNIFMNNHYIFAENMQRRKQLDVILKTPEDLVKYVNNEILTNKCPYCNVIYDQFDGCCALTCSSCSTYFCAYCDKIKNTSYEIHNHIKICSYNISAKGDFWPKQGVNTKDTLNSEKFEIFIHKYPAHKKFLMNHFKNTFKNLHGEKMLSIQSYCPPIKEIWGCLTLMFLIYVFFYSFILIIDNIFSSCSKHQE